MTVALIHPRFAAMHRQFFESLATIQGKTVTHDDYGQETEVWANTTGLVAIPATKAPLSAVELQAVGYTATDRVWHVLLRGAYPQITTRHHVIVDGETFDIDAAETDQTGSMTRLRVSQVTT